MVGMGSAAARATAQAAVASFRCFLGKTVKQKKRSRMARHDNDAFFLVPANESYRRQYRACSRGGGLMKLAVASAFRYCVVDRPLHIRTSHWAIELVGDYSQGSNHVGSSYSSREYFLAKHSRARLESSASWIGLREWSSARGWHASGQRHICVSWFAKHCVRRISESH